MGKNVYFSSWKIYSAQREKMSELTQFFNEMNYGEQHLAYVLFGHVMFLIYSSFP